MGETPWLSKRAKQSFALLSQLFIHMNQRGWVMVHRKIEENDLWFAEPFSKGQAWIDILLLANHQEKSVFIRGNEVIVGRGQFIHSEETLAKRWRWSRGKTRAFLELLVNRQMLDNRKSRLCAIRTVLNYDEYQKSEQQTRQQNVQQKANRMYNRPDTNNNGNNDKNEIMEENNSEGEVALRAPTPAQDAANFFENLETQAQFAELCVARGIDRQTCDREISKFIRYWTEPTRDGKRQRWELEKTFEVRRRLVTWFGKLNKRADGFTAAPKGITL